MVPLISGPRAGKVTHLESRVGVARARGKAKGHEWQVRTEFQLEKNENIL